MRHHKALIFWMALSFSGLAFGQTFGDQLRAGAARSPDLSFPAEAKELSTFSQLTMAVYKPPGAGPFPAIVIHHSCGGLRSEIQDWAKKAVERGYVAFVLDSYGPRGVKNNCDLPAAIYPSRGAKDAFQALAHLKTFAFVDSERVGFIGFSWGGVIGTLVSSRETASALSTGGRFAAAVSFYPLCYFAGTAKFPNPVEYLRSDSDKPLLVLMGELDNETPPSDCIPRLEALKKNGAPVDWHLYTGTTHCWDCGSISSQTKVDYKGSTVLYSYSRETTADSTVRAFDFFGKHLGGAKR
jgi:dienelactone hydrolase